MLAKERILFTPRLEPSFRIQRIREEAFRNALESCDVDAQCDSAGILAALDETLRDVTLRGDAHEDLVEALQGLAEIAAEYDFGYSEPADDESR